MIDQQPPTVAELVAALPTLAASGSQHGGVTAVTSSSSQVIPGAAFVAIPGRKGNRPAAIRGAPFVASPGGKAGGQRHTPGALARGALLVVGQQPERADFPADRVYA